MTNTFNRLLTGTRALESRLTTAFEQAAQTVTGVNAAPPPLEIVDLAVNEIGGHVQPAGRGRYSFPFNQVTITFVAPTREDEARFEAICAGPPAIDERVAKRLASAGCESPDVDVTIAFVDALAPQPIPRYFDIALARVDAAARDPRGPHTTVSLTVTHGASQDANYAFSAFPVAIGRGADVRDSRNQLLRINHVAFIEGEAGEAGDINRTVSRRHARIELDEASGRLRLVDDNSAQGTSIIRGTRGIAVPRGSRGLGLQSDDEIVLGQARIKVTIGPRDPASAHTEPRSRS